MPADGLNIRMALIFSLPKPLGPTIYYVGPTPAKPGQVIGSAGPTTSGRMDAYAPTMMSVGEEE